MRVVRWVLLMLAVPIVVSCGGSSDASRVGRYSGIWRGTLTEGGRTITLLIDQRQTGAKTKGYARVIDGDTIQGGILRGHASATGYTASVDFGGTTGTVNLTASGDDASVQMVATGGSGVLRDARGSLTNTGVGPSPAGTWTIAWTDDFDNTGSFDIEIALVDGGYEVLPQEIDLPGLSGFRNLDISVIGMDVVFKSVLTVYEQNSVINWSIPALGGNGVFQGMLEGPDNQVEVNGPCTSTRKS